MTIALQWVYEVVLSCNVLL